MSDTARLRLPVIAAAQAQKHVTHNEALVALDTLVQLCVLDKDLASPPGSPAEGDCYIVAASATGAWTGWDGRIARYEDGAWRSFLPGSGDGEGWQAYVRDEGLVYVRLSGAWSPLALVTAGQGTWTPTVEPATPGTWSASYGNRHGAWVRTGSLVWVQFLLSFTPTVGTGSGDLRIGGLPFSAADTPGSVMSGWAGMVSRFNGNWTWPPSRSQAVLRVLAGGAGMVISGNGTAVGTTNFTVTALADGSAHIVEGSAMYLADG